MRELVAVMKLIPVRELIQGQRILFCEDSIVRGTTSMKIVEMVRNAGAAEVHMRISSPPTMHSCFYGIDTPSTAQRRDEFLVMRTRSRIRTGRNRGLVILFQAFVLIRG